MTREECNALIMDRIKSFKTQSLFMAIFVALITTAIQIKAISYHYSILSVINAVIGYGSAIFIIIHSRISAKKMEQKYIVQDYYER